MAELKPCPFCGQQSAKVKHSSRWGWFVSCQCAAVGSSSESREGAIIAWNTRAAPKQVTLLDILMEDA